MHTPPPEKGWDEDRPPTDGLAAALDETRDAQVALRSAESAPASVVAAMALAGKARALESAANAYLLQVVEAHAARCRRREREPARFVDMGEGRGFGPQDGGTQDGDVQDGGARSSRLDSVPSAPAFTGSADPRGLVRTLRDQRASYVARRDFCTPGSPQHDSYSRKIADTDAAIRDAIEAARQRDEVPS